jgi:hypothetical protein
LSYGESDPIVDNRRHLRVQFLARKGDGGTSPKGFVDSSFYSQSKNAALTIRIKGVNRFAAFQTGIPLKSPQLFFEGWLKGEFPSHS